MLQEQLLEDTAPNTSTTPYPTLSQPLILDKLSFSELQIEGPVFS